MPRQSLARPVQELADVLRVFVRSTSVTVLALRVDARLRAAALELVSGMEFHADNRAPLLTVDADADRDDGVYWEAMLDEVRLAASTARDAGAPLGAVTARPVDREGAGNVSVQLLQTLASVSEPAQGLMLTIAARGAMDGGWLARVADIASAEQTAGLRWILIAPVDSDFASFRRALPAGVVMEHEASVDAQGAAEELQRELDAEQALGPGVRGAGPRGVKPPPRPRRWRAPGRRQRAAAAGAPESPGAPAAHSDDVAGTTGADVAASQPASDDLLAVMRLGVARAALAMHRGDGPQAVTQQAGVVDACVEHGALRDAVTMELMLGAYLVELTQYRLASEALGRAALRATEIEARGLAAEAFTAQGSAEELDEAPAPALAAYRHAIESAKEAGRPRLALQAYWRAGLLALSLGLDIDCIGLWADAVVYAAKADDDARAGSPAKAMAERLSELLARRRRFSEAREIERISAGL